MSSTTDAQLTEVYLPPPPQLPLSNADVVVAAVQELESLRLLRATLESFKQLVRAVDTDTAVTTPANYAAVADLTARWESVFAQTAPQAQRRSEKEGDQFD